MTGRFVSNAVTVVLLTLAATIPACVLHAEQHGDRTLWEMPTTFEAAQGYRYELEIDGVLRNTPTVSCTPSPAPVTCALTLPSMTGIHTGRLRAVEFSVPGQMTVGDYSAVFVMERYPRASP
jgi:hypothetical protein